MATTTENVLCPDCGHVRPWHLRGCKRLESLPAHGSLFATGKDEWASPLPAQPPAPLDNRGVAAPLPTHTTPAVKAATPVTPHGRDAQEDARRLAIVTDSMHKPGPELAVSSSLGGVVSSRRDPENALGATKPPRQAPWKTVSDGSLPLPRIRSLMAEGKGWRTVALILSGELGRPVSHMAVKRALERAGR